MGADRRITTATAPALAIKRGGGDGDGASRVLQTQARVPAAKLLACHGRSERWREHARRRRDCEVLVNTVQAISSHIPRPYGPEYVVDKGHFN